MGVDIAERNIDVAKHKLPHIEKQISVIDPNPVLGQQYCDELVDIVISIQTLDFLSNTDFKTVISNLYNNMKPGALIYASMNGWDNYYREHAEYDGDGLWNVKLDNGRINYDIFLAFIKDKEEMKERFSLFKPIYLDHYDSSFREEGSEHRYTFLGVKE